MWLEGEEAGGTSILSHKVSFFVLYSVTQGGLKVALRHTFLNRHSQETSLICAGPLGTDPVPISKKRPAQENSTVKEFYMGLVLHQLER